MLIGCKPTVRPRFTFLVIEKSPIQKGEPQLIDSPNYYGYFGR